jgi:hypothetical protein
MRSFYSDACTHNQHLLCKEEGCQCGCHYLKIDRKELEALKGKVRKEEADILEKFLAKFVAEVATQ